MVANEGGHSITSVSAPECLYSGGGITRPRFPQGAGPKSPRRARKTATVAFMAPSRTSQEQTVLGADDARADQGRGSAMDFSTSSAVPSDDVSTTATGSKAVHAPKFDVTTDSSRDALLTEFGKDTLRDRYLLPGENYQDLFARVAAAYSDDADHAQRVYDYISKLWFMPATPVLSNGGTGRGLPISCYLNSV